MTKTDYRHLLKRGIMAGALVLAPHMAQGRAYTSFDRLPAAPAKYPEQPGQWSFEPSVLIAADTPESVKLCYRHTAGDMPAGTILRVLLEPITVKDLLHTGPSEGLRLVPLDGKLPNIKMEPARVHGVGFRNIDFVFPDGLKVGDSFAVELGNEQPDGSIKPLVNSLTVRNLSMEIYTVFDGTRQVPWLNQSWRKGLPLVSIEAGEASYLRLFAPVSIEPGKPFALRIAATDRSGVRSKPIYTGAIELECEGIDGLPSRIALQPDDGSFKRLESLSIKKEGVFRIRGRLAGMDRWFESNPIVVRQHAGDPIYWGAMHHHTCCSECWGDTFDDTYAQAKEMAGYDFFATSDHKGQRPTEEHGVGRIRMWRDQQFVSAQEGWEENISAADRFNDPGRFITLSGYELSTQDSGHYNIYWEDCSLDNMMACQEKHYLPYYSDYIGFMFEFLKPTDAIAIPHVHATSFPYLSLYTATNYCGKVLNPVYEVYSDWGGAFQPYGVYDPESRVGAQRSPEAWSFLALVERGYRIGVQGDADHHGGYPGRLEPGGVSPSHDHVGGLTAVRMPSLTKEHLFASMRARKTYATTGERVFLDFNTEGQGPGSTVTTDDRITFNIQYAGTSPARAVRLYDGTELVKEWTPGVKDVKKSIVCRPWQTRPVEESKPVLTQTKGRMVLIPGTEQEKYFIAQDNQSTQLRNFRFTNLGSSIVYGFKLARGEKAKLLLDIDLQFKVSVSGDGDGFESVLEEPVHMKGGGNRELREVDLTPVLKNSDAVFVKIEDKWPEDGLGARFHKLILASTSMPDKLAMPEKNIQFRFKDRVHPYMVEVVQEDGNRACSSPIWVARKTVPELVWQNESGALSLVNAGNAAAEQIEIAYAQDEFGFPVASTPMTRLPEIKEDLFFAWTERIDHRRLRVHLRWHGGSALSGTIQLAGIRGYELLANPAFRLSTSSLNDSRTGKIDFTFDKSAMDGHRRSMGIDFEADIDPALPNTLRVQTKRPVAILFGTSENRADALTIALNGRKTDRSIVKKTVSLEPGETWTTKPAPGFWVADPTDRITERTKMNNWIEL